MEAEWQADRSLLRDLIHTRPDLSLKQISAQLGRSYNWVKKWARRLATAPPEDLEVLHSRSRARQTRPAGWDPLFCGVGDFDTNFLSNLASRAS